MGLPMGLDGATEIARRSRGTPRIAGRLLRRVRDFAEVARAESVTRTIADEALTRFALYYDYHRLNGAIGWHSRCARQHRTCTIGWRERHRWGQGRHTRGSKRSDNEFRRRTACC